MAKKMYMMRHGETLFNQLKRIQGWCDSPLTEMGIKQAMGAKKFFEDNGIVFDHAYSSTSERSCDTLEIITDLPYKRLKGLKEMNFGKFEGQSETLNPPRDMYETFFKTFGGETRQEVRDRLYKTCKEIMDTPENECVLVVSHAGACVHFMTQVTTREREEIERSKGFKNCTILEYTYEDGKFELVDVYRPLPIE